MRRAACITPLCLIVMTVTSSAQERPEDRASMEALNTRGFESFERKEYVEAAAIFQAAYDLYQDANLLKNVAIAHYAAADCKRARATALLFLKEPDASAPDREEMTRLITRCDALDSTVKDDPPDAEPLKPIPTQEPIPQTMSSLDVLGGVLMGVGAATLIGAGIYHSFAFSESEELKRISMFGGDPERYAELSSSADTARVALPALYLAGTALMGSGAWLIVSPAPSTSADTSARRATVRVGFSARF